MLDLRGYNEVYPVLPDEYFSQIPAGGYICKVVYINVTNSKAGNLMLVLYLDIAEGKFKNWFKEKVNNKKFDDVALEMNLWNNAGIYRQLIYDKTGKVSKFLKGLFVCFEKSNDNLVITEQGFDENKLIGCKIGFVFTSKKYKKKNGESSTWTSATFPKSVEDIYNNKYSIAL